MTLSRKSDRGFLASTEDVTARMPVWRISLAVAIAGALVTGLLTWWMWDAGREERSQRLQAQGEHLADSVSSAMDEVVERLLGLASFIQASESVDGESFRIYTENLETIPGMRGLGYLPVVPPDELEEMVRRTRESLPGFEVFEVDETGDRVPVSTREFHAPVQWFEPADDPARPHGFDTASDDARLAAMMRAIVDKDAAVTTFLNLVDEGNDDSFLVFWPVTDPRNGETIGFTVAPMELNELLEGQISAGLAAEIEWEIETVPEWRRPPENTNQQWATVLDVGNQWWLLTVTRDPGAPVPISGDVNLWLIALAGVTASVVAAMSVFQFRRRKEAQKELDQLRSLSRAKDEFLASVSHELRTPLTSVLGFAELLRDENTALSDAERRSMISNVAREATDLASIIDDLLVAARSELDLLAITKVPVSLKGQVAQVIETLGDDIHTSVGIVGTTHLSALGDPARVRQVIRNLLSNADRYGGDNIEVRFGSDEESVWVEVADDGEGIPSTEWERIFEPYYRAHRDRPTQPAALGIGLSVARHLARLMDGDLSYRREDGWSVFTFALPADQAATVAHDALQSVGRS